jgi:hypothetical protein
MTELILLPQPSIGTRNDDQMLYKYSLNLNAIPHHYFLLLFQCLKHPYFKVSQDPMGVSSSNVSAIDNFAPVGSPQSAESKQIFTDDWQNDGVISSSRFLPLKILSFL